MTKYPGVNTDQGRIEILLNSSDEVLPELSIEFILDIDKYGEVIGIEILHLMLDAGADCLDYLRESGVEFSYDEDSDSFYMRLKEGTSLDQMVVQGKLLKNNEGQVVGFRAPTSS